MEIKTYKCDICGHEQKEVMLKARISAGKKQDVMYGHVCEGCTDKIFEALEDIKNPPRFLTLDDDRGVHVGVVRVCPRDLLNSTIIKALGKHYDQEIDVEMSQFIVEKELFTGKRIKIKLRDSDYSLHVDVKETKIY